MIIFHIRMVSLSASCIEHRSMFKVLPELYTSRSNSFVSQVLSILHLVISEPEAPSGNDCRGSNAVNSTPSSFSTTSLPILLSISSNKLGNVSLAFEGKCEMMPLFGKIRCNSDLVM